MAKGFGAFPLFSFVATKGVARFIAVKTQEARLAEN